MNSVVLLGDCVTSWLIWTSVLGPLEATRSSADADNGLDAFSGQSRSITMALFF